MMGSLSVSLRISSRIDKQGNSRSETISVSRKKRRSGNRETVFWSSNPEVSRLFPSSPARNPRQVPNRLPSKDP